MSSISNGINCCNFGLHLLPHDLNCYSFRLFSDSCPLAVQYYRIVLCCLERREGELLRVNHYHYYFRFLPRIARDTGRGEASERERERQGQRELSEGEEATALVRGRREGGCESCPSKYISALASSLLPPSTLSFSSLASLFSPLASSLTVIRLCVAATSVKTMFSLFLVCCCCSCFCCCCSAADPTLHCCMRVSRRTKGREAREGETCLHVVFRW